MEMIGRLVATLFISREVAHRAHLAATGTGSFSKHMALGEFYPAVGEHGDTITEAYQGRHGLIGPITLHSVKKTNNVIEFLEDSLKEIEDARYEVCDKSDSSLQQLIDNIVEVYLRTLYKLKFLA